MFRPLTAMALLAALTLSACEDRTSDPEPVQSPSAGDVTPDPSPSATSSILRPDVAETTDPEARIDNAPLILTIGFPDGGSDLDQRARAALRDALEAGQFETRWPIWLGGHSDAGGNDAANERVSRARAEAVADFLIDAGIDEDRIRIVAFGEQNPVAPNALANGEADEQGRAANRRVELVVGESEQLAAAIERLRQRESAEAEEAEEREPSRLEQLGDALEKR